MVSFWPWKAEDNSPASFEKALANLSEKVQKRTIQLDGLRQRSRRFSVLWMLYAGFAYLLCSIILVLIVGWRNWGSTEYCAVAGSPILIYFVRLGLTSFYDYRTSLVQAQLDDLQKQRDVTIRKLKTATKYDSTQELLKKYGGTPTPKPKSKSPGDGERKITPAQEGRGPNQGQRTTFVPPPTANIPGRQVLSPQHETPEPALPPPFRQQNSPQQQQFSPPLRSPSAEFAPNAFPSAPQYAPAHEGPHWYDRLMEVLLGEDETLPGKRLALICSSCRLVNGQAPPGVIRLEDVGKWRCAGCGAMNGVDSDLKKLVNSIKREEVARAESKKNKKADDGVSIPDVDDADEESDVTIYSEAEEDTKESVDKDTKHSERADTPIRRSSRPNKGKKET